MTARPPVLRQELVERLRALASGGPGDRRIGSDLRRRASALVGRPIRKVVVRLVDPSLQATLDQLTHEATAAASPATTRSEPEVEVLRAELASAHLALVELRRRVEEIERTFSSQLTPGAGP